MKSLPAGVASFKHDLPMNASYGRSGLDEASIWPQKRASNYGLASAHLCSRIQM
jgi:hypothetical protein